MAIISRMSSSDAVSCARALKEGLRQSCASHMSATLHICTAGDTANTTVLHTEHCWS
jgi:hypothetical protein